MASTVSGKGIDHYKWHRLLSGKASTVKSGIACLRKGKLRRRHRERHLKVELCVSVIICQLFQIIRLPKCVLCILELNWYHWRLQKETKLCHHVLTSSI